MNSIKEVFSMRLTFLPVKEFLSFFNITLEQYFSLLNSVPFPIVRETGRVVYKRGDAYRMYDMHLGSPSDTDTSYISYEKVLEDCFVDFSEYEHREGDTDFRFRTREGLPDMNRTYFRDDYIETQTLDSSTDLRLDKKNGIYRAPLSMTSVEYPFTSLDIYNTVSPMLAQIKSGDYTGSFVNGELILTPKKGSFLMSNSRNAVRTTTPLTTVVDQNKSALITATKLEVGALSLDLITEQVLKSLPAPIQLLATNNPLVKIAIANLINVIIIQTGIQDPKVQAVNEAMLTVSWMETIKTFDFKAILDGVLSNIPAGKLDTLVAAKAAEQQPAE